MKTEMRTREEGVRCRHQVSSFFLFQNSSKNWKHCSFFFLAASTSGGRPPFLKFSVSAILAKEEQEKKIDEEEEGAEAKVKSEEVRNGDGE